jgi:4-amino-4-deoxy-L-arabinose transferase-like glycosyltransferase
LNTTTIAVAEPTTEKRRASSRTALLGILFLFAIIYLGSAFTPGLQDDVDSTHAEAAREMITRGDYVTLHVNGVRYLEKAPLMYWLIASSFHIFGVNAFATRVPTMLAMLGLTLLAMHWGRRTFGDRGSTYGGLFVVTAMGYFLFTRVLFPEAILSLFIAVAFYSFLTALDLNQPWRWYVGYLALALAVLTKGLLPLVIIGIPAVAFVVLTGDWRRWREFRLPTGLLLFLAIAAPWHILAGIRNDRFFWFYFINEHVLRFLGERYPKDYNKLPPFLYWSLHLVWLFPWSLFLPVAIRRWIRDYRAARVSPPVRQTVRYRSQLLWLLWAVITLVFFAFSTNQEYYTFPAYLPLLLLLAGALAEEEEEEPGRNRWLVITTALTAVIALAASGTLFAALWSSRHLPFVPDIGDVLAKPDLSADTLSMGHMLDLTGQSFAALRLPAFIAAITLLIGPPIAFFLRHRGRNLASTWATAATLALFLVAAHIALVRFDPYLGSSTIAADLTPQIKPQDHLMIYGDQAYGSSLLFYMKRPIELVDGATTSMWFGSTYPDAPQIFLKDVDLLRLWKSDERVFLFVPRYQKKKVDSLLDGNSKYVVSDRSGKIVYSNRF